MIKGNKRQKCTEYKEMTLMWPAQFRVGEKAWADQNG